MIPPKELLQATDAYEWFKEMRKVSPVRYDEERQTWDVFCYEGAQKTLTDYKTFSSQMGGGEISLLGMDPPKHKLYRSIVAQAFTPISIEKMEPRIEQIARELLSARVARGEMDIIADLAFPLPVIVIAEMLGVPAEDRELFKKWSDALVADVDIAKGQTAMELLERKQKVAEDLYHYFGSVVEEHRKHPKDDLISALLQARIEEQSLDEQALLSFCLLLLVAGNETTTNLIGNAMLTFLERPQLMEKLRADRSLLPTAIEEVLRFRSPVQSLSRRVTTDTVLNGQQLKAGDRVIIWLGSANRDERQFENADQFMYKRHPNRHIAFGHGIHFCLGAALARLEARVALHTLLQQAPTMALRDSSTIQPLQSTFVYGYPAIPVTFNPYV
ncbi:hypothetical protein BEP19_08880 [Ammoniphilus oxalaticus]|uniref:Cytochrome P450 n=2 Tax=Ammoniphilus oxalaticus TaxID=66863 RepID=A0A419SL51_9BACL|nr:hypothetical protein BEP19_08880 [Ammoniphilus oxalaticus]